MNNSENRIIFNTWSGAFFDPGGGELQLRKSKEFLEKSGFEISLYDQWSPQKDFKIFHQFSICPGIEHPLKAYKQRGAKVALSTIMWTIPDSLEFQSRVKEVFQLSDILFTNSDLESKRLSDFFSIPIEKFHKTRNGISKEFLDKKTSFNFKEKFNIKNGFVLSVANIDQRKNTHTLLNSCKKLGLQLVTIGHVRDHEYFKSFKQNYDQYIHFGPIEDAEVLKSAYQQCDLFALPSICETPGIAALEAGSQGAKIVITDQGSTREYFKDEVTYTSPFQEEDVIKAMSKEFSIQRSTALSEKINKNYTWRHAAKDIKEGYKKIL